ncbi:MAG: glycoside hydrolase family 88 protein [Clostridiales bacterium]|jgi:unsaturated rhamnogalacturonyl hydrolase|nr:glycoside hydrolase family 88 protein [Clostridiales bacterium]
MIKLVLDEKEVRGLVAKVVERTMQMDEPWEWPSGVAYYGVSEAYRLLGEETWLKLLKDRADEFIGLGLPPWTVNTCAMGHCLLTLAEAAGEGKYNEILAEAIAYLRGSAPRFGDPEAPDANVLQHTVSVNNDFPEQAWADTLFMAAFLMLRVGARDGDRALVEDALNQYAWHIRYLQDETSGLWYHGYDNKARDHMSGFFWARANAWAALTCSQVRLVLPEPYLYPPFMDISCSLRDQLAGLKRLQTSNGLWHTVLDDAESYEELSASCGIAAAMLTNGNPLHTRCAQKACEGIMKNISEDGRLLNVSGGTAVMRDLDGYRKVPNKWIQGWGQGLALVFLTAALRCAH